MKMNWALSQQKGILSSIFPGKAYQGLVSYISHLISQENKQKKKKKKSTYQYS